MLFKINILNVYVMVSFIFSIIKKNQDEKVELNFYCYCEPSLL